MSEAGSREPLTFDAQSLGTASGDRTSHERESSEGVSTPLTTSITHAPNLSLLAGDDTGTGGSIETGFYTLDQKEHIQSFDTNDEDRNTAENTTGTVGPEGPENSAVTPGPRKVSQNLLAAALS
jgi:hypothetical protein